MSQKSNTPNASNGFPSFEENTQNAAANNADIPSAHAQSVFIPAIDEMAANMLSSFGAGIDLPPMNYEYSEETGTYVSHTQFTIDEESGPSTPLPSAEVIDPVSGVSFDLSEFTNGETDPAALAEEVQEEIDVFYNDLISAGSPEEALELIKVAMTKTRQKYEAALGVDWDEADLTTRRTLLKLQYDGMGIGFAKADPIPIVNQPDGFVVQQIVSGLSLDISQHILDDPADQSNFTKCATLDDHFYLHLVRGTIFAPMIGELLGLMEGHRAGWHVGSTKSTDAVHDRSRNCLHFDVGTCV